MTAVSELLARGAAELGAAQTTSPDAEARTLLAHVLGRSLGELILVDHVDEAAGDQFADLIQRRAQGVPVQHLIGIAYFRTISVSVGPGVFVPRPETEVMTGWAIDQIKDLAAPVVIDACTGSGAIAKALATEVPHARVMACELSEDAFAYAVENLAGTGAEVVLADLDHAFADLVHEVDLVISNPPYIPLQAWESVTAEVRDHDPALALWSGEDGLDAMRILARRAAGWLKPGGWVTAEHAEVQADAAPAVFVDHGGFDRVRDHRDLSDRSRFVTARAREAVAR